MSLEAGIKLDLDSTYEGELDPDAIPGEESLTDLNPDPVILDDPEKQEPDSGNTDNDPETDKVTPADKVTDPVIEEEETPVDLADENVRAYLAERFQVEDLDEVEAILDDYDNVVAELEALKKGPAAPVFANDFQRRAYEHALRFESAEDLAAGFNSYVRLTSLDVPALEQKDALREVFRLENPEIPDNVLEEVFEDEYYRKYEENPTARTPYLLQREVKEAKAKLAAEQEKAKAPVAAKAAEPEQEEVPAPVQQSIAQHVADFRASLNGLSRLTFQLDADETNTFNFEVAPEQLEMVEQTMLPYLQNPARYDKDGKLAGEFNAIESRNQLLVSMNYDKIVEAAVQHGINIGKEGQIKAVAGQQPTRTPGIHEAKKAAQSDEERKAAAILNFGS